MEHWQNDGDKRKPKYS